MNVPFYIAKRYAVSFSKNTAINIITGIASLGIVAGTMALFVVLSAFSGLKEYSLKFISATGPDFKVEALQGKSFLLSAQQENQLTNASYIESYSKTIEERVLFYYDEKEQVAYLKGVDANFTKVCNMAETLYVGEWFSQSTNEAVIGSEISRKLGVGLFDFNKKLKVYSPKAGKGTIDNIEDAFVITDLQPIGIYSVNEDEDAKYVYCSLDTAQYLLQFPKNKITNLEIKAKEGVAEEDVVAEINAILGAGFEVKNKIQQNDSLYKMLNTENAAVYLIFTLVIIIALFNLIGSLIMMVIDKKANLKTLYNLGIGLTDLRKIFLHQGMLLTVIGGMVGLLLGVGLVLLQLKFEFIMINERFAYPVVLTVENVIIVVLTIGVLGFLASYIASRTVSKKIIT